MCFSVDGFCRLYAREHVDIRFMQLEGFILSNDVRRAEHILISTF